MHLPALLDKTAGINLHTDVRRDHLRQKSPDAWLVVCGVEMGDGSVYSDNIGVGYAVVTAGRRPVCEILEIGLHFLKIGSGMGRSKTILITGDKMMEGAQNEIEVVGLEGVIHGSQHLFIGVNFCFDAAKNLDSQALTDPSGRIHNLEILGEMLHFHADSGVSESAHIHWNMAGKSNQLEAFPGGPFDIFAGRTVGVPAERGVHVAIDFHGGETSGSEPLDLPGVVLGSCVEKAVVQPVFAPLPKLDLARQYPVATPK